MTVVIETIRLESEGTETDLDRLELGSHGDVGGGEQGVVAVGSEDGRHVATKRSCI